MPVDKLQPNDPRVQHRTASLNGHTYAYLYSPSPATQPRGTILLIHGFPDLSFGWRHQIPFLTSLGLTVIAPDCLGYGRSDAPPSSALACYGYKRVADDMAELCRQLGVPEVILGGHDWGGAIVYRIAQYHPGLVKAVFSICTPYFPPSPKYEPLSLRVARKLPQFGYQLQFAGGDIETHVRSPREIRQFLDALYGARTPDGLAGWDPHRGVLLARLPRMGRSPLLGGAEMAHYVREYARHGVNGPLNWYRAAEVNYVDELAHFFGGDPDYLDKHGWDKMPTVRQEVLFVLATKDQALRPFMAERMGERIPRLTRREVDAGHWCLWQRPEEINGMVAEWLEGKVLGEAKAKL